MWWLFVRRGIECTRPLWQQVLPRDRIRNLPQHSLSDAKFICKLSKYIERAVDVLLHGNYIMNHISTITKKIRDEFLRFLWAVVVLRCILHVVLHVLQVVLRGVFYIVLQGVHLVFHHAILPLWPSRCPPGVLHNVLWDVLVIFSVSSGVFSMMSSRISFSLSYWVSSMRSYGCPKEYLP